MPPSGTHTPERVILLERLAGDAFDLLVIGGGITGAGVARDAAMRGLRVALVEQADFASGTSSRSSRLVHGGVRYLEHGNLALVFESSRERRILLHIAPHLVRPLSFTWPVYRRARIARWKLSAALTLYDALSLFRNVGRHRRLSARGVLDREPRLSEDGLLGGAQYWDAATDDARLTLATIRSALDAGAVVLNHARAVEFIRTGGRVAGAVVMNSEDGRVFNVRARVIVNATGPWSDRVERLADPHAAAAVHGSKGVHVLIRRDRIGNVSALTLIAPADGRVMFVLPAGDFAIVGTTDTFDDVLPDDVRATEGDVAYLLAAANHFFPAARLGPEDVISAWAGLRPLASGSPGTVDAGSASREHDIRQTDSGLVRITGGKLTTYRAMAAEAVDLVQRVLALRVTRSGSDRTPLHGGEAIDIGREGAVAAALVGDADVASRLVRAHGSAWRDVWRLGDAEPALRERIVASRPYILAELRYAVREELARTLGDLLIRRIPLAFETADHGRAAARRVVGQVAGWLRWSSRDADRALAEFDAEIARIFTIEPADGRAREAG